MIDWADPTLRVLVVAPSEREGSQDGAFASSVLQERGDEVEVHTRIPDALERLARGDIDLAIVSLSLPRGDGLAFVHHLRALHPQVDVIVLVTPSELEDATHAMALGVLQAVMRPLTGDALLVAVDRARERRILLSQRRRLGEEARWGRLRSATYARCASFIAETDANVVGERLLRTCADEIPLVAGALYAPPHPGAATYVRATFVAGGDELPPTLDEDALARLDPTEPVQEADGLVRLVFLGTDEMIACAVLVPESPLTPDQREALTIVAALGTAALTAARKVDAIARAGLKDPETSAYTFAYFGDVAGREIDRATRHGRRFALMTIAIEGLEPLARELAGERRLRLRRLVTDTVLSAVRDSDVLARVEDEELYLLLPETGLLGALAARRRIQDRFNEALLRATRGAPSDSEPAPPGAATRELGALLSELLASGATHETFDLVQGIAVFPQDGTDLGRLLRTARRRAEQSRHGVWRRLGLGALPFGEALTHLLETAASADRRGAKADDALSRPGRSPSGDEARPRLGAEADELASTITLSGSLLARVGAAFASDARRQRGAGVLYVVGDDDLASAVLDAIEGESSPVRASDWEGPQGRARRGRGEAPRERSSLVRAWVLDPLAKLTSSPSRRRSSAPAPPPIPMGSAAPLAASQRAVLGVDDPSLAGRVLLLGLTELGGYALVARRHADALVGAAGVRAHAPHDVLYEAFHGADLDLVDGLVSSLQREYRLQPEAGR
ncbi:MAG: response regulator [Myxococcales bacterium]|nr:response regulator [Myxococcales bacterium]